MSGNYVEIIRGIPLDLETTQEIIHKHGKENTNDTLVRCCRFNMTFNIFLGLNLLQIAIMRTVALSLLVNENREKMFTLLLKMC